MQDQVLRVVPANQMSLGGQHASTCAQCNGTQKLAVRPREQGHRAPIGLERWAVPTPLQGGAPAPQLAERPPQ